MIRDGLTIAVRDLFERLPLPGLSASLSRSIWTGRQTFASSASWPSWSGPDCTGCIYS